MLTDTDLVSRPCPCGNGEVETTISTPTQGPISSYSIRRAHRIKCADCDRQYVVDGNTIVSRTDLAAYRAANEQWSTAFRELNESSTAVEVRTALAAMLATFRTKNAAHDYLTKAGLNDATYSSFIREYTGANEYAAGLHPLDLPQLLRFLGHDSGPFEEKLQALEAIRRSTPSVQLVMQL